MLLSRTALILHSFGSSFGEEAATIRGVPSVRIREGGSIYGVDVRHSHCNHPQLQNIAAANAGDEEQFCFQDGLQREVCQPKLKKKLCKMVDEAWGLDDAYC